MASSSITEPSYAHRFATHGFVFIRGCLSEESIQSFVDTVASDLLSGRHNEAPLRSIGLKDPSTWPKPGSSKSHRIIEVVPQNRGCRTDSLALHWQALNDPTSTLGRALDDILGPSTWEVPVNGDPPEGSRHWYVPVTLPEVSPLSVSAESTSRREEPEPDVDAELPTTSTYHVATLGPVDHLPSTAARLSSVLLGSVPCSPPEAAALWQPVNRRRIIGKGWHVDSFHAHSVVVLLLLSDWTPGGGGTALIPGTHAWVYRRWLLMKQHQKRLHETDGGSEVADVCPDVATAAGCEGDSCTFDASAQRALNGWVMGRMRTLTEAGRVRLMRHGPEAQALLEPPLGATAPSVREWCAESDADEVLPSSDNGFCTAVQVVGKAGDVVLMHPLLVHSGTINLGTNARILANGLARTRGGPRMNGHLGPIDIAAM